MASSRPETSDDGALPTRELAPESASATPWTDEARSGNPPLESTASEDALTSPPPNDSSASRWTSISLPFRRVGRATVNWIKGPQPPQIQKIRPFLPRLQSWPIRTLNRYVPKRRHKITLLLAFYFCWLLTFVAILHHSAFANDLAGYGSPTQISCVASFWASGNGCGLNGNDCRPFDNSSFPFRCSANCASAQLLNPHAVGTQELIYQQLVVGGGPEGDALFPQEAVYRADSFICAAAIHSGIVSNADGGCGVVRLVGQRDDYVGSERNGIRSVGFDSTFPRSLSFVSGISSECKDLRWPLLAVSVIFTCLISLFTTSPAVFFVSIFVGIYFQVGLASDPPGLSDYYSIVSILLGRFLPAAFVAFVIYRYCVRRTLDGLHAQIEKTVLWLGGCWVGGLNNMTFGHIPISRLTPRDLKQQPGAIVALTVILVLLFVIALGQVWFLRLEGRLPRFLALYILFGVSLGLFVAIPNLNLRIHHYILALLLLPGTSMQTRPSLLYQGILVGLFINGVARWGFDSILQTPAALLGDGQFLSPLPDISNPIVHPNNITFNWGEQARIASNQNGTFDGMSVLVNDVERFRGYQDSDPPRFTWTRPLGTSVPYYFRFAFMQAGSRGDYTRAGVWGVDGSWTQMAPGPSR